MEQENTRNNFVILNGKEEREFPARLCANNPQVERWNTLVFSAVDVSVIAEEASYGSGSRVIPHSCVCVLGNHASLECRRSTVIDESLKFISRSIGNKVAILYLCLKTTVNYLARCAIIEVAHRHHICHEHNHVIPFVVL